MNLIVALLLTINSARAADAAEYWKQLYAAQQVQCGTSLVDLAKQLDDDKAQIAELQKQLNAKTPSNPEKKQ
jgi:hypothetical protein